MLLFAASAARGSFNPQERVLIEEKLASNSASIAFTKGIDSTYKIYEMEYWGVKPATDNSYLRFRVTIDGGSSWVTASTAYQPQGWLSSGSGAWGTFTSGAANIGVDFDSIPVGDPDTGGGTGTMEDFTGTVISYEPSDTTARKRFSIHGMYMDYTADVLVVKAAATYLSNSAVNGFQWTFNSGNISTGTFRLYGVK